MGIYRVTLFGLWCAILCASAVILFNIEMHHEYEMTCLGKGFDMVQGECQESHK